MENLLKHKLEKMLIFDRKILEVAIVWGSLIVRASLCIISFMNCICGYRASSNNWWLVWKFSLNAAILTFKLFKSEKMRLVVLVCLIVVRKQMIQRKLQRNQPKIKTTQYSPKGASRGRPSPFIKTVVIQELSTEPEVTRNGIRLSYIIKIHSF